MFHVKQSVKDDNSVPRETIGQEKKDVPRETINLSKKKDVPRGTSCVLRSRED